MWLHASDFGRRTRRARKPNADAKKRMRKVARMPILTGNGECAEQHKEAAHSVPDAGHCVEVIID